MISFSRWPPPVIPTVEEELLYPACDEVKLAESTRQFDKIVLLYNNLELLFADRADVLVAGSLFWYPVETRPEISQAPDVIGIRFGITDRELRMFRPSGESFQTFTTLHQRLNEVELRMEVALDRVEAAMEWARAANEWAETEAKRCAQAEIRAKIDAKARAEAERRIRELEAKLRAAGIQ